MRHRVRGKQLSRDTEHRLSLRRNMTQSLIEHGTIRTTLPKALQVQPFAEKLITIARRGDLHARRAVIAKLQDRRLVDEEQEFTGETVIGKLFKEIAPRYKDRSGGYTRIIKLADYRIGDGGDLVVLQLVGDELESKPEGTVRKSKGLRKKRNERKFAFAKKVLKDVPSKAPAKTEEPADRDAGEDDKSDD
ncbi:MAG: 50S ribosomal protein L17 [Planctomycetota bacterium]